ncbi:MAG: CvpA family protein [Acidobacteriota bacterium]
MTPTLNIADLSLAIIWLFFAIRGYMRGLVKEVGSLAAIITAFYLAGTYHKALAPNLTDYISGNYAGTAAYLLIFTVTLLGVWFLALAISGIVKITMTQWADRFFGGGFGLAKGVILTAVLLFLIRLAAPNPDFLKGAMLVPVLDKLSARLVNYIPPDINDKLRKFGRKELPDPIKAALEKKAAAAAAATAAAVLDKKPAEAEKKPAEAPKPEPAKAVEKKPEPAAQDKKPAAAQHKPEAAKKPDAKPVEPAKKSPEPAKPESKPEAKPAKPEAKAGPGQKTETAKAAADTKSAAPAATAKQPAAPAAKPTRPTDTDKSS